MKCDEYLSKAMVQIETLSGKFADFDDFVLQLTDKQEELYNAFESRKVQLVSERNQRASALMASAERILKGIEKAGLTGYREPAQAASLFHQVSTADYRTDSGRHENRRVRHSRGRLFSDASYA